MIELRWYQEEAINSIYDYFASGKNGNPIVALPTGTGKSLVISGFVYRAFLAWPWQRMLVLTHVKELIEQNASKLFDFWPTAPIGIYSAGLNKKEAAQPIVFGGIASVIKNIELFGYRDLIIIDECHLVSDKQTSMYITVIEKLKEINPNLKVIGLTATPYRLKMGQLTEGGIFTDLCYNMTDVDGFNRLLAEGYLVPPVARATDNELDVSNVKVIAGEYNKSDLEKEVDKEELTYKCVRELVEFGYNRHCWLIFASGISHSEHVSDMINSFGISSTFIHSKLTNNERDSRLNAWKSGAIKAIVNNGILTTGIDLKPIDLIGMLRPTMSCSLWVQMLGRGIRPYNGELPGFDYEKTNCLVLDFAGNTKRLGPINDPVTPQRPKKGGSPGDAPVKICENCGCYNHSSARYCGGEPYPTPAGCGYEFPLKPKIQETPSDAPLLRTDSPELTTFDISKVIYSIHRKNGSEDSMLVSYYCGLQRFKEYVCFNHSGYALKRAHEWWKVRTGYNGPDWPTTEQAVNWSSHLPMPSKVKVWVNKKYPEIVNVYF